MAEEKKVAAATAPAEPQVADDDSTFGMNDEDFWVDENTGAVFIGETPVVGRGRRPTTPPPPPRTQKTNVEIGEETFGLRDEDFQMDDRGNISIGNIRVKEEGIDNTDPIAEEFERNRMTADQREEQAADQDEKQRQKAQAKEPPPSPQSPKEWSIKVADEERVIRDENELLGLARKGVISDLKLREIAEMRKTIEPFYQISLKLKDDPGFVEHVKSYGQPHYQVEAPEPFTVAPDQFEELVKQRVDNQMIAQKIYWDHDKKYGEFNGYPKAEEVRQKLLSDSLHWDKFTRDWVDKNPVAYADKFQQAANVLIRERMLDPNPARPIPPAIIERQRRVLESLREKEVAKEKAKVESAKSAAISSAEDGRLALNRARKRAMETGTISDWADVIAKMGLAD